MKEKFKGVISGCPRSGTSLMMLCLKNAIGEDKIIGEKWPNRIKKGQNESEENFQKRKYIRDFFKTEEEEKREKHSENMNPNGFWECRYTVQGIQWHPNMPKIKDKYVKIVNQGLSRSDPDYIGKVLIMNRHPRKVAKSQENIIQMPMLSIDEKENIKVHTPKMYCNTFMSLSHWITNNKKESNIKVIDYDDLVSTPNEILKEINLFFNEGDFSNHPINSNLKRSNPEKIDHHLWEHAENIYELVKNYKWKEIVEYGQKHRKDFIKEDVSTPCTRLGRTVSYNECQMCLLKKHEFLFNSIKQAEQRGIDWKNQPCMYRCLKDIDNELISMNESVKNNHWIDYFNSLSSNSMKSSSSNKY